LVIDLDLQYLNQVLVWYN